MENPKEFYRLRKIFTVSVILALMIVGIAALPQPFDIFWIPLLVIFVAFTIEALRARSNSIDG